MLVQGQVDKVADRNRLEQRWLELTRVLLPAMAKKNRWPISQDHCFQRVLLDAACHGQWYDRIEGRPAYKAASDVILAGAVSLGENILHDAASLQRLNRQSLAYRGKI